MNINCDVDNNQKQLIELLTRIVVVSSLVFKSHYWTLSGYEPARDTSSGMKFFIKVSPWL